MHFDVFNGDADGICALHQLRLAAPMAARLVTGPKHDIGLLSPAAAHRGDTVTVLDISLDTNRAALLALLERGVEVEYFDHHFAGAIPSHRALVAHIDPAPDVCTSMLVDRHLSGRHRLWAIVAAFGDNLASAALGLAQSCGLSAAQAAQLRELGESMNHNAYGDTEADLIVPPAALYAALRPYSSPFDFIAAEPLVSALSDARRADIETARKWPPATVMPCGTLHILPDARWARRVRGTLANELANAAPNLAHAVLTTDARGDYAVSVRAPLAAPHGADRLCQAFAGGGRVAAAAIDVLAHDRLDEFKRAFERAFCAAGCPAPKQDAP